MKIFVVSSLITMRLSSKCLKYREISAIILARSEASARNKITKQYKDDYWVSRECTYWSVNELPSEINIIRDTTQRQY